MSSILDELIFDRTEPGRYDWRDFNRVGQAVAYIADELYKSGYKADVVTKTDWTRQNIQTRQQMEQYIQNIQKLRNILVYPTDAPDAPDTMRFLTFQRANDIERIVSILDTLLESLRRIYMRSGMPWAWSGVGYYIPEITYILCDSEGVVLQDEDGNTLTAR